MTPDLLREFAGILKSRYPNWRPPTPVGDLFNWKPYPGPQTQALLNPADELYFGGAAGGGKTYLIFGMSLLYHINTLILRRRQVDTKAIAELYRGLPAAVGRFRQSGYGGEFRTHDNRMIEINGCEHPEDWKKYQGRAHDAKFFDELCHFTEGQYTTISAWNRVLNPARYPNQRCRVIGTGNPPTDPQGEWVLKRWAAWLDPTAGEIASPGELRWYIRFDDDPVEHCVPSGEPIQFRDKTYRPRSRSFIPARVEDNPAYMAQGYDSVLNALPEPLRSQMRYGDMSARADDDRWQLIPTTWIVAAQKRWIERQGKVGPLQQLGVDVAMEGKDTTAIAKRHTCNTISEIVKRPGSATKNGQAVVELMIAHGALTERTCIDTIGVGKSAYDVGIERGLTTLVPVVASASTNWRDPKVPKIEFVNTRAAMYWNLRLLFDPEGDPNTRIAIPPDRDLQSELAAHRYKQAISGIQIIAKDDVKAIINRSPDLADAVAMACWGSQRKSVFG